MVDNERGVNVFKIHMYENLEQVDEFVYLHRKWKLKMGIGLQI